MSIVAADILFRLSGGAANTNPNLSLGGAMSTAAGGLITTAVKNNLFDDVTGDQSANGLVEYRGFYVVNSHATLTLLSAVCWLDVLTSSPDDEFDIALDTAAVGAAMGTIANEAAVPASIAAAFARPTNKAGALAIGDIPPGSYKGIWLRRTVNAGAAAFAGDSGSVRVEGDTL